MERLRAEAVALRVGAWIETSDGASDGLQHDVALRVGAWIETFVRSFTSACDRSPSVWGRGLKQKRSYTFVASSWSPSVWGRGLKLGFGVVGLHLAQSPSVWGRGLKRISYS